MVFYGHYKKLPQMFADESNKVTQSYCWTILDVRQDYNQDTCSTALCVFLLETRQESLPLF